VTISVQLPPLSSIQRPASSFFTISPTRGGLLAPPPIGGSNPVPEFGGGLTPPYGPAGSLPTFGGSPSVPSLSAPPPRIVEPLPDSNTATYTCEPSGLTASARGSSPSIAISCGSAARSAGSNTCTTFACEHETNSRAPPGAAAITQSNG